MLRRSALALALCAVAAARAAAQEPADRQGAVREEAIVSRIVIDAHVIGPDGNPIPDLTAADFRVKIDGKQAIVEAVDWLPAEVPETDVSALVGIAPDEAARFRSDVPPGRLILMFFQTDQSISRLHGFMRMAQQARLFLSTLLPTDRVAVASFDSHLKLRQDFTSDRGKVEKAIQSAIRTGPPPRPTRTAGPRSPDTWTRRRPGRPRRPIARSSCSPVRSSRSPAASPCSFSDGGSGALSEESPAPSPPRAATTPTRSMRWPGRASTCSRSTSPTLTTIRSRDTSSRSRT